MCSVTKCWHVQCRVPFLLYNTNRMWTSYSALGNSNRKPYSSQRYFLHHYHHRCHVYLQSQIFKHPYPTRILHPPPNTKIRQHFEVLSAVLLDIQVFWDVVTLRLMRGSWHFEGLLCFHLQVSNMDLSTTCKISFFLDCLTLEDEHDTILQNTGTTHPMTWMTWILSTRFVWTEICNTRLSNMNSARHWFSVSRKFLLSCEQQQNSCCLNRSTNTSNYTAFTCNI